MTYAFDPAAHHPSWLAKRAVTVDHLSGGRLDLRLAVGAEDAGDGARAGGATASAIPRPRDADRHARGERSRIVRGAVDAATPSTTAGTRYRLRGARLGAAARAAAGTADLDRGHGPRALAHDRALRRRLGGVVPDARRTSRRAGSACRRCSESEGRAADALLALRRAGRDRARRRRRCSKPGSMASAPRGASSADTRCSRRSWPATARPSPQRIADYEAAGATDLMLGFADFPLTAMLEMFAAPRSSAVGGDFGYDSPRSLTCLERAVQSSMGTGRTNVPTGA